MVPPGIFYPLEEEQHTQQNNAKILSVLKAWTTTGQDWKERTRGFNPRDTASSVQPMNQKSDGIALGRAATHDWSPAAVDRLRITEFHRAETTVTGSNLIFWNPSSLETPVRTIANLYSPPTARIRPDGPDGMDPDGTFPNILKHPQTFV